MPSFKIKCQVLSKSFDSRNFSRSRDFITPVIYNDRSAKPNNNGNYPSAKKFTLSKDSPTVNSAACAEEEYRR